MSSGFSPNPLVDLEELFAYPFMVNALEAGTIVAVMAALVGWFMVLRRQTFAGHTLSVMAFPGAATAALAGLPLAGGYYAFCVGGALLIAAAARTRGRRDRAQETAAIGTVQAGALAIGFVALSLYGGVLENLETLLFGSFLGISATQVLALLAVACAALAFLIATGRPLWFASVDEEMARAAGVPVSGLAVAFLVVLGLAVAATAQITGALLVFALLAVPPAAAQLLTVRAAAGLILSVLIAIVVTWLALAMAYFTELPVGFLIAEISFAVYLVARAGNAWRYRRARAPRPAKPAAAPISLEA
jgi:zinc/manganese transport system permease protein